MKRRMKAGISRRAEVFFYLKRRRKAGISRRAEVFFYLKRRRKAGILGFDGVSRFCVQTCVTNQIIGSKLSWLR